KDFADKANAQPAQLKAQVDAQIKIFEDRKTAFAKAEAASRAQIDALSTEKGELDRSNQKLKRDVGELTERLANVITRAAQTSKHETFLNEEPQGKVTKRLADGIVEIDLGSDAL